MLASMNVPQRPARGRNTTRAKTRTSRPTLEVLEDRMLLYATSGGQWAHGSRITYSLIPDGTSIGGTPSNLVGRMTALGFTAAVWVPQFQKAAAAWEAVANINLSLVGDDGTAIGAPGNQQGAPNFGDIRIGGYSQGSANSGQLAFAFLPPPYNGGTTAGDIFLNTDQSFQVNGSAYDLETIAIHEFGHALGMGHSQISAAVMYASYTGSKQSLTSDDIQGIDSIYGPQAPDAFSNNTFATALNITGQLNSQGQATVFEPVINSPTNDVDYYYVTAPASTTGSMTVTMQSANLSSLSPYVLVYNQAHTNLLAQAAAPNSYGGTATVTITGVSANQGYYIRCQAAQYDSSGVGAYGLQVNFGSATMAPIPPPNTVVLQQPDQGGGGIADKTPPNYIPNSNNIADPLTKFTVGSLSAYGDSLVIGQPTPTPSRRSTHSTSHAHHHRTHHHHQNS